MCHLHGARSKCLSSNLRVAKPDSPLWPTHRVTLCESTSGFITLHTSDLHDNDMFCDAEVMRVAPTLPDLNNLGQQRKRDIEKMVREFG